MHKRISILIVLIVAVLSLTACGSKGKNLPANPNPEEVSEYVLSAFAIPGDLKANSNITWTATEDKINSGILLVDLVGADPKQIDPNSIVQDFLDRARAINKDGKVTIEKLNIQIKDIYLNSLVLANYVFNGQDFDEASQDPTLTYPINQSTPPVAPTAYP